MSVRSDQTSVARFDVQSIQTPTLLTDSSSGPFRNPRSMAIDSFGALILGDSGGIYRTSDPNTPGSWQSLIGAGFDHLMPSSVHWDTYSGRAITGTDSFGALVQDMGGSIARQLQAGPSVGLLLDTTDVSSTTIYAATRGLSSFDRIVIDNPNDLRSIPESSQPLPLMVTTTAGVLQQAGSSRINVSFDPTLVEMYPRAMAINSVDPKSHRRGQSLPL